MEIVESSEGCIEVIDIFEKIQKAFYVDGTTAEYVVQRNYCFAYSCDPVFLKDGHYADVYGKTWKKIA